MWLLVMPAAHSFSFPEDWENIRKSMLTRKREQELQVRRKHRIEHQEEHAHQEEGAGAPGQKEAERRARDKPGGRVVKRD